MDLENGTVSSLDEWKASSIFDVTLPSGRTVRMRLPDPTTLIVGDALPETLRTILAREILEDGGAAASLRRDLREAEGDPEKVGALIGLLAKLGEMQRLLVLCAVVEPALTEADLEQLPQDDLILIAAIAQRDRATDATGRRVGTGVALAELASFPDEPGSTTAGALESAERAEVPASQ